MNIVHFQDEPWDSGIADYAVTLAAEQARRGHRVAVWGTKDSPALARADGLGLATRGWTLGWLELPALRRELAGLAPQILNAHTGSAHALALLLAPAGAAVVRTRGDARPPRSNPLTRLAASRTEALIAANSVLKAQLEAAFPGTPVRLVRPGIAGPEQASPMAGTPVLGMIARLDPVKGHDVLLDAARALEPRVRGLQVLCAGEGARREILGRRLEPEGLGRIVRFLGRVPDRWAFLSGCRIGIVASLGSEAVSRAALEWMAAGRPLIATKIGGIPDLVEDGITGLLVPPGNAGALARAVTTLLGDPARAEAMGRAARTRWERLFSLSPFFRSTQDAYDEAIDHISR